jgi:CheY-like chemotaxis protein
MSPVEEPALLLLADDDSDDRLLVKDALEECQWGGELRCVENGEELLDYLRHRGTYQEAAPPRPKLILLDLNMPRKDGRQALREIKADPVLRRIPVVILTTSKADTDIDTLYDLGANSFISKPVQFADLVNVIRLLGQYWFNMVELPASK